MTYTGPVRDSDAWFEANRKSWDARTPYHIRSAMYDVPGFMAGKSSLSSIEVDAVGSVEDKTLLHLQCHFGLDTLSWARLGAQVTGLDFSEVAIEEARSLAARAGLSDRARFVCANVYDAPAALGHEAFDVVFASFGALCWLPDLGAWARVVAACLRPGGSFHLVEFHPALMMLDESFETVGYPYDGQGRPERFDDEGTYADRQAPIRGPTYEWNHGLGTVVTSLRQAGLRIDSLTELDWSPVAAFPGMVEVSQGRYRFERFGDKLPLVYATSARKQYSDPRKP